MKDGKYYLKVVENLRRKNNHLHMGVYNLAWKKAPKQFKQLVREISENDRKIDKNLRKMVGLSDAD